MSEVTDAKVVGITNFSCPGSLPLSFGEEHSTADLPETVLKMTPEKETLTPGEVIEMPQTSFEILKKDIFLRESVLQKYLVLYLVNCFLFFSF